MISSLYAAILALLIVWLSLQVIKLRWAKKVRLGDGGEPALQIAILVHFSGIAVLAGRILHARGLLTESLHYRILGMKVTIFFFNRVGIV